MRKINFCAILIVGVLVLSCNTSSQYLSQKHLGSINEFAVENHWVKYGENPVIESDSGTWDAGALGTPCMLVVDGIIHLYYEAWGVRSDGYSHSDYASLQIGHATSIDGIHFVKDKDNPVVALGKEGEFDYAGSWDPFVIYEDGLFKMWYGGGVKPNELGYATSKDGSHFTKQQQLSFNLKAVNDMHIVHDAKSKRYYQYYWHRAANPSVFVRVGADNEIDFEFDKPEEIIIDGEEYPGRYFFSHVFIENGKWYMFYSNFIPYAHATNATIRFATSDDGLNWKLVNNNLMAGLDGDVVKVSNELYIMYYGKQGYYDKAGQDIRMAVYSGSLDDMPRHTDPLKLTNEQKEMIIENTFMNKYYYRTIRNLELTDEQEACVKTIAEERCREEVELEYVQKLKGSDLNRELRRINKAYNSKLAECIGNEKLVVMR